MYWAHTHPLRSFSRSFPARRMRIWSRQTPVVTVFTRYQHIRDGRIPSDRKQKCKNKNEITCSTLHLLDMHWSSTHGWYMPSVTQLSSMTSILALSNHVYKSVKEKSVWKRFCTIQIVLLLTFISLSSAIEMSFKIITFFNKDMNKPHEHFLPLILAKTPVTLSFI